MIADTAIPPVAQCMQIIGLLFQLLYKAQNSTLLDVSYPIAGIVFLTGSLSEFRGKIAELPWEDLSTWIT